MKKNKKKHDKHGKLEIHFPDVILLASIIYGQEGTKQNMGDDKFVTHWHWHSDGHYGQWECEESRNLNRSLSWCHCLV